ncbi:MAG TPA: GTP 3',8-cyclase MoaA [bacterium]|nr:GTP 3',8-cyclase MoaA [bacterium]
MPDIQFQPFRYLRLSLTDRCNFRCVYCLPEAVQAFHPSEKTLQWADWNRLVPLMRTLGIRKVRLTGGEPTLHPRVLEMVELLAQSGFEETALTTNGFRLEKMAPEMKSRGLTRVNVHLDSLDPQGFDRASQTQGLFERVLAGIRAAKAAGLSPKVNVVLMRGANDQEAEDFIGFSDREGVEVRFIELMPTGSNDAYFRDHFIPVIEVQRRLRDAFGLEPVERDPLGGPSRRFRVTGSRARVGFIGASCEGFCDSCQRLRLTSEGFLKRCLFEPGGLDLKPLLRRGAPIGEMTEVIQGFLSQKWTFNPHVAGPVKEPFPLARIGG